MSSRYLEMVRGQRRRGGSGGVQFTAKSLLALIAVVAMIGSSIYWWGVQSQLTDNKIVAIAFTAILVLAPPSLTSFLIPWSPGGMLLQKINARTWGYVVVLGAALYLIYYSFEIQYSWWAAQPTVADTGLVLQQVIIGIIGFIIIPALLWTPVTSEELMEQVRQAHLVKRYELQTQADIAILRATLLRAQELTLVGFSNLNLEQKEELAAMMRGLVSGIDGTLKEIGQSVKIVSGATVPFEALNDNDDIRGYLDYIHESLTGNSLGAPEIGIPARPAIRDERDAMRSHRSEQQQLPDPRDRADNQLDAPRVRRSEQQVIDPRDRMESARRAERQPPQDFDDDDEYAPRAYRSERQQSSDYLARDQDMSRARRADRPQPSNLHDLSDDEAAAIRELRERRRSESRERRSNY